MIGVRKFEIGVVWFSYAIILFMTFFSLISGHPDFYTNINFWIAIVLNVVMFAALSVFKIKFAEKNKIKKFSKFPLNFSDSQYAKLVDFDIFSVGILALVDYFLYMRMGSEEVNIWMFNFAFIICILLFLLSYMDRKYGPKELTRKEKLEERRKKQQERIASGEELYQTPPKKNSSKKKKKYETKKRKK